MLRRIPLLVGLLASGIAVAADPVFPPGSRIGLVPPAEMTPARGISGFRDPRTGAAIVTLEMPADAYPSIAAGFTDEALKAQGFTLRVRETPKVGDWTGLLVSGEQSEGGRTTPKSVLLASDPTMTVLVIGQLPSGAPPEEVAKVERALRSVSIRPPLAMNEQLAALPFRLVDQAGFRPIRAMAGNSLLLTDGDKDIIKEAEQPILIVAQSFAPAPPPDGRDAFARSVLVSNTFLKDPVLERSQGYRQGGADWHEIVARARDGHSDNPVVVMQTIRFERDSYIRSVGVVRSDQRDLVLPRFRRVVDSVALQ